MDDITHDVLKFAEKYLGFPLPKHTKTILETRGRVNLRASVFYTNQAAKRKLQAIEVALTNGRRKVICVSRTEKGAQQQIDDILAACDALNINKDNFKFEKLVAGVTLP